MIRGMKKEEGNLELRIESHFMSLELLLLALSLLLLFFHPPFLLREHQLRRRLCSWGVLLLLLSTTSKVNNWSFNKQEKWAKPVRGIELVDHTGHIGLAGHNREPVAAAAEAFVLGCNIPGFGAHHSPGPAAAHNAAVADIAAVAAEGNPGPQTLTAEGILEMHILPRFLAGDSLAVLHTAVAAAAVQDNHLELGTLGYSLLARGSPGLGIPGSDSLFGKERKA